MVARPTIRQATRWCGAGLAMPVVAAALTLSGAAARGDDWPQWMGPQRDGILREEGLIRSVPEAGLEVKWRAPLAGGYSGPAVADGKVFVTDYLRLSGDASNDPGARRELTGKERVHCLNAETGETLWKHEYDCVYQISYPAGPRATPTVDGDRVYALGAEGNLFCLKVENGEVVWSVDFQKDLGAPPPIWGFCSHPLVEGDLLITLVGGKDSTVVAFDKHTGKPVWKALSAPDAGYCPPSIIHAGGTKQLIVWHPESINSLNPATGEVYWTVPLIPNYGMSIMAPQFDGKYLFASAIGEKAVVLELDDQQPAVKREVWRDGGTKKGLYAANATPLLEDGTIFGVDCQTGALRAVSLTTGEREWETFSPTTGERRGRHGTAFLVKNVDRHFLFSETGELIVAEITPQQYRELGRFQVLKPTGECFGRDVVWSHPAFAQQCVFARNDAEIVCVSLKEAE